MLQIKVINKSNNPLPKYQTIASAGMDLHADLQKTITLQPGERKLIPTGLFIELPLGYEAQVRPRSGLALKHGITVLNSPGTIDADYRGEIKVLLVNHGTEEFEIEISDTIKMSIELSPPSVQDLIDFKQFTEENKRQILTKSEKDMYDVFSKLMEKTVLYINKIKINGDEISDFKSLSIPHKLNFLHKFNHSTLNNESIQKYIKFINNKISKLVKCKNCGTENTIHLYFTDLFT